MQGLTDLYNVSIREKDAYGDDFESKVSIRPEIEIV